MQTSRWEPRLRAGQPNSPTPTLQRRTTAPRTHSRAPPPPVTFIRTNLSPPDCRPPLLLSCFRRRRRRRLDATRAWAAAAAAVARERPSVRPPGCVLKHFCLYHSPFTTHPFSPRFFPFSLLPFPPRTRASGGLGPVFPLGLRDGRGISGREGKQMATAGGAKMEPASCMKQFHSRNALRCLRFVPPWQRHSAERGGEAKRARERDLTSASRPAPAAGRPLE